MELVKKYRTILSKSGIDTPLRLAHFFSQCDHESNLKPISENLNYSVEGLMKTFKKYFPTKEVAEKYARKPEKIANRVYANRMGNGDEASGDGWKYRGKGFIQTTGKNNYQKLSKATGINYIENPNLLLNESGAVLSAIWYWTVNNLNKYADKDDIDSISDIINIGRPTEKYGDANGFRDRKEKLDKYKKEFGA